MLEENKFSYRALLHGKDAKWYFARGLDDITAAGSYEVRLFHNDMESLGITTADCDKEHYVVAHLFVSESAATGRQQALRVVGQTLLLTICATNAVKAFTRTCETTPKGASWGSWVDLGAASTTDIQDGSITAQKLSSDIRPNAVSPLRPLFIAAGAEYNDTGVDISKTAPWGETVTHKAGHYYLNGLGDITEEEMMAVYNAGIANGASMSSLYEGYTKIRTCLRRNPRYNYPRTLGGYNPIDMNQCFQLCSTIETINVTGNTIYVKTAIGAFQQCEKLVRVYDILNFASVSKSGLQNAFATCLSLEFIRIKGIKVDILFSDSTNINKGSLLYMIQNAMPASAITITLHPNAYNRLSDDSDIVAALEAQPLVSLVSA